MTNAVPLRKKTVRILALKFEGFRNEKRKMVPFFAKLLFSLMAAVFAGADPARVTAAIECADAPSPRRGLARREGGAIARRENDLYAAREFFALGCREADAESCAEQKNLAASPQALAAEPLTLRHYQLNPPAFLKCLRVNEQSIWCDSEPPQGTGKFRMTISESAPSAQPLPPGRTAIRSGIEVVESERADAEAPGFDSWYFSSVSRAENWRFADSAAMDRNRLQVTVSVARAGGFAERQRSTVEAFARSIRPLWSDLPEDRDFLNAHGQRLPLVAKQFSGFKVKEFDLGEVRVTNPKVKVVRTADHVRFSIDELVPGRMGWALLYDKTGNLRKTYVLFGYELPK